MKTRLLILLVSVVSCKSTDSINRFAKSSSSGLAELDRSTPSFSGLYKKNDPSRLKKILDTGIYGNAMNPEKGSAAAASIPVCMPCKTADSLTSVINQTLTAYFTMLQELSDKKLIAYHAEDLVSSLALIQAGVAPSMNLTDTKISAIKSLLNAVLNEPLKVYRYQKLQETISRNDSALGVVIGTYRFILDTALRGEIELARANYVSFVYAPLYGWAKTPVEKQLVNREFGEYQTGLSADLEKIHQCIQLLNTIRKGHHSLATGGAKNTWNATEAEIAADIIRINTLVTELVRLVQ